jgi:hypothetical protein
MLLFVVELVKFKALRSSCANTGDTLVGAIGEGMAVAGILVNGNLSPINTFGLGGGVVMILGLRLLLSRVFGGMAGGLMGVLLLRILFGDVGGDCIEL